MQETQKTWVRSVDREDPLKKGMTTNFNILAWRISWTEEPGGLQSMKSQRVGCDWETKYAFTNEVFVVVHFPLRSLEEKDGREAGMWGGGVRQGSDYLYPGKYANQMEGEWRKLVKRKVAKIWEKPRFWEGRGEWLKGRRKVQIQILAAARETCWCHPHYLACSLLEPGG